MFREQKIMLTIIFSVLCLTSVLCSIQNSERKFIYDIYKYNTLINISVDNNTEYIMQFSEESNEWQGYPTRVHVSTNESLNVDNPVFVTATQQKGLSSWELPLLVQTHKVALFFANMARTLCPHDAGPSIEVENRPTLHVTTSSPQNVSVTVKLRRVTDFYVPLDKPVQVNVTPSTPKYYYFSFDKTPWNVSNGHHHLTRLNYTIPRSVILMIDSDNEVCATVSIQNNSCPVFDNENDALYKGYHLTMTTKGGITLTQAMFPNGFYIVFIVKESDDECTGDVQGLPDNKYRLKNFTFRVIPTISYQEYALGAMVTLALLGAVATLVLVATLLPASCKCSEEVVVIEEEPIIQASTSGAAAGTSAARDDLAGSSEVFRRALTGSSDLYTEDLAGSSDMFRPPPAGTSDMSTDRDSNDVKEAVQEDRWSHSNPLTVHRLTRAPPETLARRSDRYFWGALTVALVYALPVVQLLFTYQMMVVQTGNQDLCYYNFLCAHPLGFLSDFNHVYSNVGYVLLGVVFMAQVRHRQLRSRKQPQDMGIPQHFGVLYSMGLGLIMEGLLSASYHLCPNKMNFQFDSSFMYVIAVLVMIKLYQNRHSDIIPSAHSTFMVIAFVMTICLFGILFPSVYFSVAFTVLHLLTCFIFTLNIYYAGDFRMECAAAGRAWQRLRARRLGALRPAHPLRAAFVALANVANWSLAIYSATTHNKDLARQLLAILMGNAILYMLFYMAMKVVYRERVAIYTWIYFVLAHVAWFYALTLFLDSKTKWSETPASSRRHNAACSALGLFDSHDQWHVASAAAMFLSFNLLLTIDDLTFETPRQHLKTF